MSVGKKRFSVCHTFAHNFITKTPNCDPMSLDLRQFSTIPSYISKTSYHNKLTIQTDKYKYEKKNQFLTTFISNISSLLLLCHKISYFHQKSDKQCWKLIFLYNFNSSGWQPEKRILFVCFT